MFKYQTDTHINHTKQHIICSRIKNSEKFAEALEGPRGTLGGPDKSFGFLWIF